jgi:hypothetical protein
MASEVSLVFPVDLRLPAVAGHSWAASMFVVATCLWHVHLRRPTGPWLQVTRGVRRRGYLRELSERLQNLLIVEDGSRRGFLYFKLCADLLDLRLLLFKMRSEGLYFFLLLRDRGLEVRFCFGASGWPQRTCA